MVDDFYLSKREAMPPFTVLELLVVVAIIGVLAALLLPAMSQAKDQADRIKCHNNLKNMVMSMNGYVADNDSEFPEGAGYWSSGNVDFLGGYLGMSSAKLRCRGGKEAPYQVWKISGLQPNYGINRMVAPAEFPTLVQEQRKARRITRITHPSKTFIHYDGNYRSVFGGYQANPYNEGRMFWFAHGEGFNAGFVDGHTERVGFHNWSPPRIDQNSKWCAARAYHTLWK